MDIETASPPVSPSVVAAILMIQNPSVTSGTLAKACSVDVFMEHTSRLGFAFERVEGFQQGTHRGLAIGLVRCIGT